MEDDTRSALDIGEEGIEDAFGNDLDEAELTRVYEDILRKLKAMERIATKLYNKDMKEIAREEREDTTPYAEIDLGLALNK